MNAAAPTQSATDKKEPATALPGSKVKWPQQVKAAKNQWGKLSEAELLKSDGNAEQLSRLVQQRYNLAPEVANNQVKSFLNRS
ncbi:MAG: general stress protein CsbD [Alkalimonas sp.]|nr:general stress protein CsbD [Alkalimonas sp.]